MLEKLEELLNSRKSIPKTPIIIVGLLILSIVGFKLCSYELDENTQAVVTTFGEPKLVNSPGLNFKIPFIQKVEKVNTSIKGFSIGYDQATGQPITSESLMITKDYNFVNVDFYVSYQIVDPIAALYNCENVELVLKNMAQNCIRDVVASYNVDPVLTTGKIEIQSNVKKLLSEKVEKHQLGIAIKEVSLQDSEPPSAEVQAAFDAVEDAKSNKTTAITNANEYANEIIPAAEANADSLIQNATATKTAKINEATGQASRFLALYEEYSKFPLITKRRMFYEAMEELLPNMKVIIENSDGKTQTIYPIDSFANITNGGN